MTSLTSPPGVGVGTSITGMTGGGPQATAAFENPDANAIVRHSSSSPSAPNSSTRAVFSSGASRPPASSASVSPMTSR